MQVKIKYCDPSVTPPKYATTGSAGLDLSASLKEPVTVPAGGRALIPSGIAVAIPMGYAGFVFPRSGLSYKSGITMCNSVGVIDSDYTGEIKIAVHNISDQDYTIHAGDRIAQLFFMPVGMAELIPCEDLDETERGDGGFGSTGR